MADDSVITDEMKAVIGVESEPSVYEIERSSIRRWAEAIGDTSTLHLVYLLAVADARATGPEVWNPWKAQLIRSLYERVLEVLSVGTPEAATAPEQRLSAIVEALAGRFTAEQVEAHVRGIEPGYLLSTPPATIGDHIELIEQLGDRPTAVRRDRLGDLDRLTVATRDRPGILQAVVGALAGHNADVLGGVAYTRDDGVAIQVWHLVDALSGGAAAEGGARSIDDRRWERILDAVPAAIAGEFAIEQRLAEVRATYPMPVPVRRDTEVNVDNGASTDYSVVEVHTADRRGLLYAITRTLHELALDIHLAKVDTIGPQVVDAFYVQRRNGRRVENADEIERLERRVREAVLALDEAD
ncbi:MAG: MaoC family dehydratase N-terminal domain-containing protein [Candidatus Hydrogenedentes bacterium]|nr:MaoC family dehydratase N-terminal domain-containing protein [Candidatus Hydrogenedentota bacterium]